MRLTLSIQSTLEFKLRVQEYMEHVRSNELFKAIDYSKKQLQRFDQDPELLQILTRVMGLMALRRSMRHQNANY